MKHKFFLAPLFLFLAFLMVFPQISLTYAKAGLMLWFYTLLPSLLPFLILSNLFIRMNLFDNLLLKQKNFWRKVFCLSPNGAYALLMGIFCGYPMGAKITADLYWENRISRQEACYLLTFVNYPGPSFLSTYLCTGLFQRKDLILPTYAIIYSSGFLSSLFFRFQYPAALSDSPNFLGENVKPKKKETSLSHSFGEILDISIMNAFESITRLGGYIILFSILQGILKQAARRLPTLQYILLGITEISTGSSAIAKSPLPFRVSYPLIMAFTSFGGICVTAQTKSMLSGTNLPLKPYLKGKVFCLVSAWLLARLLVKIVKVII